MVRKRAPTAKTTPEVASAPEETLLCCSFCAQSQYDIKILIAGTSAFICGECVENCNEIIREQGGPATTLAALRPHLREIMKQLDSLKQEVQTMYKATEGIPL